MTRASSAASILALLLLVGSPVGVTAAQDNGDAEAKALFEAGREAFESGRYDAALARWQDAYDLSKRPTLLYNIGLASDRVRQDDKALASFRAYLDQVPQTEKRAEVEGRIRALEKAKSERDATAPPTPAQVAAASPTAGAPKRPPGVAATEGDATPWPKRWYVWAGVGGAIAAVVVIAVVASAPSSETTRATPNTGVTLQALGGTL